ncbi:iron sulfur assembly-related protein [Kluyveromyces marxianus]|uniref:Iron-sulfur assembly protein 1 n=1 Tax=Kluyveromyces marxianus (strain DMKU3-1042 / BCC 29191 / NBRC 104275) TaxID=1003335 RepID=W0T908_KLUMD|nr:iron sulfur assembly-related protein [Kluyveromyces marxianus DMKU3-1042]BAO40122.1 iron sulfur assembly-related protein [Kluyveromyces marxianus DMKU3-1042]BAP71614.1 iron sulfur assembly-related protein [Kluyveromyces marxianus]
MQRHIVTRINVCLLNPSVSVRHLSQGSLARSKRFLQTSQNGDEVSSSSPSWPFNVELRATNNTGTNSVTGSAPSGGKKTWFTYSLPKNAGKEEAKEASKDTDTQETQPVVAKKRVKRKLRPRKALISLTPNAISHLRGLLQQPEPKLIRIGVKNRGCSGLTYDLQYITKPGKFDEIVEQDGVKVVIDSKALFSIVGSEMDWIDDKLSSKFVFKNPNSKGTCGCGESFMV